MKGLQASLSLSGLLVSHQQLPLNKASLCSQSFALHKPALHNLSGVDFSNSAVSSILNSGSGGSDANPDSNSPIAGLPSRVSDRSQRASGPRIDVRQAASSGAQPAQQCPSPPVLSCSPAASSTDSCCVQTPGGILVHTQFWDTDEGQQNSWGIHGLWPDQCDGSFIENCDRNREYTGAQIVQALDNAGLQSTLDFMDDFWVSNDESPEDFWSHEWATHGTCVSTLEPSCFDNYQTAQETALYFPTVVSLFQQLNTFNALQQAGITPSDSKTYTLSDLTDAVQSATGYTVDFVCEKKNTLSQVQYYLNAEGPVQDGQFVESNPSREGTCASSGLKYPVKSLGGGEENQAGGEGSRSHAHGRKHKSTWRQRRSEREHGHGHGHKHEEHGREHGHEHHESRRRH